MKHHSVLNSKTTSLHMSLCDYKDYITTFLLLAIWVLLRAIWNHPDAVRTLSRDSTDL